MERLGEGEVGVVVGVGERFDQEACPLAVDFEVALAVEPVSEDDQAGAGKGFVEGFVDVSEEEEIGGIGESGGVLTVDMEVSPMGAGEVAFVDEAEAGLRGASQGGGQGAKGSKEGAAFHGGFPRFAGAEEVAVDDVETVSVGGAEEGFGDDHGSEPPVVDRFEPVVVISEEDGECASPFEELEQGAMPGAESGVEAALPAGEPEVGEVAGDGEGVGGFEAGDEPGEPGGAGGLLKTEMDVAGEIVGQRRGSGGSGGKRSNPLPSDRKGRQDVNLRGGEEGDAAAGTPEGGLGRGEGEVDPVALLADVKQDDVARGERPGAMEDGLEEAGGLVVGEVAAVAEVAGNEEGGTVGIAGHLDVVIELEGEQIQVGEGVGDGLGPGTGVGDEAEADRSFSAGDSGLEAEAEGGAGVEELDGFGPEAREGEERAIVIEADEARAQEGEESGPSGQLGLVIGVAEESDAETGEQEEGFVSGVVAVGVGEQDSPELIETEAGALESLLEGAGAEAGVDQEGGSIRGDQGGVAAGATGQNREAQRHPGISGGRARGESGSRGGVGTPRCSPAGADERLPGDGEAEETWDEPLGPLEGSDQPSGGCLGPHFSGI